MVQRIAKGRNTQENSNGNVSLSLPHKTTNTGKPVRDIDDKNVVRKTVML
jgi:hypothetical protein